MISYRVLCDGRIHVLDAFNPASFLAVGEEVDTAVEVRAYKRRDGGVATSLRMPGGNDGFSEEF